MVGNLQAVPERAAAWYGAGGRPIGTIGGYGLGDADGTASKLNDSMIASSSATSAADASSWLSVRSTTRSPSTSTM